MPEHQARSLEGAGAEKKWFPGPLLPRSLDLGYQGMEELQSTAVNLLA